MKIEFNNIYNMDCTEGLELIKDNSIDLIITSPPYNVDSGNNKYNKNPYDLYNDNKDHREYISWLKGIFQLAYSKLKKGGCLYKYGQWQKWGCPTCSDITQFMTKELNYIPMVHIVWNKKQVSNRAA